MPDFVGAVDQGTTSTRFMIFDHGGNEIARHQLEHEQILPRPGWVEHNPTEIWERTRAVIASALTKANLTVADLAALGITNQRETTVVWNRRTGRPYTNAIVWQDTRTDRIASALERGGQGEVIRRKAGLPPATYFSGGKLQWILENVDGVRADAENGDALFGTTDSWLIWNLTGGVDGGAHVTDVTNASRTMLMDLEKLDWDDELLSFFGIPRRMLPEIKPSSGHFGTTRADGPLGGEIAITGVLGDQQAATVGQVCFRPGEAKNTYGTGNFLLLNTGHELVRSKHGLLTTLCYQFGDDKPVYALEGSIAVTGSAVQWLRDQLGIISGASQSETLARQVEDNGGIYFVPAFSGLFAPYWRSDARGAIVGLTRATTNAHLARATLESICYQTRDVVEAMQNDSGVTLDVLRVDGGVTANELCMQLQADILGVPVSRPVVAETTALGAAYAAGLAAGFWQSTDELEQNWNEDRRWEPSWNDAQRAEGYAGWQKAVGRTLDWVDVE
ncbi:glycerol kinase GlpK [Amycolatopsis tucumanensis]|uniref:Glycerol kinase n=1 Tax=Amycolatopsis tucumanensis TaxID=401106 RepID=A0ABP7HQ85_9PSEU|nr:glycerol kinase GlpK [Amycolatopsis tucumanensis]MCF6420843.1 glycerol kinase GlpK [Amycolatopsis tucumanensis]